MSPTAGPDVAERILQALRSEVPAPLLPVFRFCLEHAQEPLSVEQVAAACGIRRRALEYRFRRAGLAPPAAAQRPSAAITGRVGDALSGAPLAGVTVSVEGTTLTTLTDETGNVPDRWRAGGPAGDPGAPPQLHSLCQGKCTLRWQRTGHKFRARGVP